MKKAIVAMLGLQGWILYRVESGPEIVDLFVGRPKKESRCPRCQALSRRVHSRSKKWRKLAHGTVMGRRVRLCFRTRRFWCSSCKRPFTERFPGVQPWARTSAQAESEILAHLVGSSFRTAATRTGFGPGAVKRVLKRRAAATVDTKAALEGLAGIVLGVDEHSFRGQRKMLTITCVAPVRRLLAILPDDRLETLRTYLRSLPDDVRGRIAGVCIDMKLAWRKELERQFPEARIVVDRFHVMQDANRRVDEARRLEQQLTKRAISRWPLVKNEEDLTPRQAEQLAEIRKVHRNVSHFHFVKEQLRDVYEAPDASTAAAILDRILLNAHQGSDAALVQWGRTLKTWRQNILNFHTLRVTNAFTEGTHTKMKLIKRLSYGFRDPETYVRKMLLGFLPIASAIATSHFLS